ncbi:MAG: hypothetical protein AB8G05_07660 [Oligoflexales bacterium]
MEQAKHVVTVGGGFGGINAAKSLAMLRASKLLSLIPKRTFKKRRKTVLVDGNAN